MRFDLTDLRLFLHVAEARSITHGAERANLALASASARVRGMEEMLGVDLLQRNRRGVALTAAGQSLADHARLVLQQVERMRGDLGAYARGLRGRVHVMANTAALTEHLPGALAAFLSANPATDLQLDERESADIVACIAAGQADIGIASDAIESGAVSWHPFRADRLVLVVPRSDPLAGRPESLVSRGRRPRVCRPVARQRAAASPCGSRRPRGCCPAAARLRRRLRCHVPHGRGRDRHCCRSGGRGSALPAIDGRPSGCDARCLVSAPARHLRPQGAGAACRGGAVARALATGGRSSERPDNY